MHDRRLNVDMLEKRFAVRIGAKNTVSSKMRMKVSIRYNSLNTQLQVVGSFFPALVSHLLQNPCTAIIQIVK